MPQRPIRSPHHPSTPPLANAFHPDFLAERLAQDEEPTGAGQVEMDVPLRLDSKDGAYQLFRVWEDPEQGDMPIATFEDWETALLFFAAVPATVRSRPTYRLANESSEKGFAILRDGETVGHLAIYHPEMVETASTFAALSRSTVGQAALLSAVGSVGIRQLGEVLGRQAIWKILGREE